MGGADEGGGMPVGGEGVLAVGEGDGGVAARGEGEGEIPAGGEADTEVSAGGESVEVSAGSRAEVQGAAGGGVSSEIEPPRAGVVVEIPEGGAPTGEEAAGVPEGGGS